MRHRERRERSDRRQIRDSASDLHERLKEKFDEVEEERRKYLRRQSDRHPNNGHADHVAGRASDEPGSHRPEIPGSAHRSTPK